MKLKTIKQLCLALTAGVTILGTGTNSPAQTVTTSITNKFNVATSTDGWNYWYDLPAPPSGGLLVWDTNVNNGGPAGSGAVLFETHWLGTAPQHQNQIYGPFPGNQRYNFPNTVDGTKYDSISFDVLASADSPTNTQGNIIRLNVAFFCNNYSVHGGTNINIPTSATSAWYHVTAPVNKADSAFGPTVLPAGFAFNVNAYGGANANLLTQTNPTKLWIDNIQANRSKIVTPPPTLSATFPDAPPGLNLLIGAGQFDRTSIKLISTTGNSWVGQPDTTYSFTIDKFPNAVTYPNNQAHIFLATPDGASSIDYNTTNLIWLNVQGNTNGTATAYFRYKIGEDHSNSNMFGAGYTNSGPVQLNDYTNRTAWAGQLASLVAPTAIGTWSMTFNQDTNVTIKGPGGVTTTFSIDPLIPTFFPALDPLSVVFGAQGNNSPPATGQPVVISAALVTNITGGTIVNDNFLADNGVLDPLTWIKSAGSDGNVALFPADPGQKLVSWTIPDAYFGLQVSTNIMGPWTSLTPTNYTAGSLKTGIVPSANLGRNQNYFRMNARKFTKLQLLLPGETADPGSVTGKTGTPAGQFTNQSFVVTVNAVDANWNLAPYNSDHTIHITSNDGLALLPADADLTGGTATFTLTLNTVVVNLATVTASDVTKPAITANTSPTFDVSP